MPHGTLRPVAIVDSMVGVPAVGAGELDDGAPGDGAAEPLVGRGVVVTAAADQRGRTEPGQACQQLSSIHESIMPALGPGCSSSG